MRTSTAYFVGAGTVIVAIVAGLGGGLLIANIVSPTPAKQGIEVSLMERRKASEPVPVKAGASEPVQYLAAPSLPAVAPAPAQPAPQTEAVNSAPPAIPPAAAAPVAQPATAPVERTTAVAQEPRPVASQDTRPVASPDTFAKAQEGDVKRDTDVRRSVEKRRAERERHQQWADKRRIQQRQELELREVEDRVRDETEPRRQSVIEPVRIEAPQIRLFGSE
jgi:hypothetical protein